MPTGLKYITVAKFDENWMEDAWSVVLEFESPPSVQGNPSVGCARFLMPNAPYEKLESGIRFELYEGATLTARVEVV